MASRDKSTTQGTKGNESDAYGGNKQATELNADSQHELRRVELLKKVNGKARAGRRQGGWVSAVLIHAGVARLPHQSAYSPEMHSPQPGVSRARRNWAVLANAVLRKQNDSEVTAGCTAGFTFFLKSIVSKL